MERLMRAILVVAPMILVVACASQGGGGGSGDDGQDITQTTDDNGTATGQETTADGTTGLGSSDDGTTDDGTTDDGTTDDGTTDDGTTDEGTTSATDTGTSDGGQVNSDPGNMSVLIRARLNGGALLLGQAYEAGGQKFDISLFRYWLSNVELVNADGTSHAVPESYYLMEKTGSKTREEVALSDIPAGDYTGIKFAIGVDPSANMSLDLFEGELTTAVKMDWGWKQGFVFFKIEGNFLNDGSMKFYKMHVGTNFNYKSIELSFDAPIRVDGAHLAEVVIDTKMETVYESINLAQYPITTYHPHSTQIADGYATMFSVLGAASTPL